ncbi:hypothetical protein ACIG3E_14945 [Streptomyces sp. NPDC053474]|uniref:hypothetical protein n=1 Tax=Streptomyces sp. NPDC053474 TaxID=3365704 RepID=UPI0037CD586C
MGGLQRDDFSAKTKATLAARAGHRCSNSTCRRLTTRPAWQDLEAFTNLGEACHIFAASPQGPRYNASMTSAERGSIQNGIWLCRSCAKIIDSEPDAYPAEALMAWKRHAEARAARDATAAVDQVGVLLADITATRDLLISFCGDWQRNEPELPFSIPFEERTSRDIAYSRERLHAYHEEVSPHVTRVLVTARHILGPDHQAVVELEEEAPHAAVNYISMRYLAQRLEELHSILELR